MDASEGAPVSADTLLARLEPSQRAAVFAREPVVCVVAGAGTGKTRVLTLRVARRVDDGSAHPSHVLVCTFSRKAAAELRQRLWGLGIGARVEAGTFHRTALRLLTRHRAERGLGPPAIVADRRRLLAELHDNQRGQGLRGRGQPGTRGSAGLARVDAEIGWAKARLVRPEQYEEAARHARRRPPVAAARVAEAYARYEAARMRRGVLDLDDLVWRCVEVLEEDVAFARGVRWWHRHLFVDEAQDLNEAQYLLLRHLVGEDPDLFVVGDPDQSVYGWNGADPAILERLAHEYPGTRVLRLRENHRCSPQVVGVAAAALGSGEPPPSSSRPDGPVPHVACLPTDVEEARWVARQVWLSRRPGRRWGSIAVLARTNAQLRRLADALSAERVPYRLAGADLGPGSDVGAAAPAGTTLTAALTRTPPTEADASTSPGDTATHEAPGRDATGTPLSAPAEVGHQGSRPPSPGELDTPTDAVVVSTFHRAKGLQWPTVFVTGLSDGIVPLVSARSRAARDEERRLLYVALTRAEDELSCSWALHPDEGAAASGAPARVPSPWLAAIEEALASLRGRAGEHSAVSASEHLARIRSLLRAEPEADASADRGAIDELAPAYGASGPARGRPTSGPGPGHDER